MQAVIDAHAVWNKRVPTAGLNRWFEDAIVRASAARGVGPAASAELHHAGQGAAAELRDLLHARGRGAGSLSALSHQQMRDAFDLPGTPIRITLREKKNPYADRKTRQR